MDRTDRIINNRAPRRMLLLFGIFLVAAAAGSFLLSEQLAAHIMAGQIDGMLAALGGGRFTAAPDPDIVAKGEAFLTQYGVYAGMDPRLMEGFAPLRSLLFWSLFGLSGGLGLFVLYFSLRELRPIYRDLEVLAEECNAIAEEIRPRAGLHGEEFGHIRRVCDGVNCIAERMAHLSGQLRRDKQELKEFLTDFSHQLKTSVAILRLNSEMLTDMDSLPVEEKARLSEEILLHLDGMEILVIEALKLAKLNADAVAYEMTCMDIRSTCEESARRIFPMLREKHISLTFRAQEGTTFPHDRTWLREALENLLKNVADHSECRHALLELTELPGAVKITLTDDGRGMEQSEIPRLFERFGKKSNNVTLRSAGVGMAIAQKIIRAHGGEITVYSKPGEGTRFEILLLR